MILAPKKSVSSSVRVPPTALRRGRVAIIRADYNQDITLSLEKKCLEGLRIGGIAERNIARFHVPGCFEIPLLARRLAAQKQFKVVIALGAVIRGETYHFDLVANECARGLMEVSLKYNVPVIFEVLATYDRRDALRRAGNNRMNKGWEAAQAALSMLHTLNGLQG